MRLVLDNVSFCYGGLPRQKKKGLFSRGSTPEAVPAVWGNAPDAQWALRDVSFTIEPGEFLGIAGHTGSGKSTLIQHLNGLLHPTCGRVLADGHDLVHKKEARAVRRQVGVVFQNPEHQLFAPTVFDDVAFGPRNLGTSEQDVEEVVREALSLVGLTFEEVANKSPFELSGGQQRRVAFAGVLAMSPEVLVLDEPVVGLDPRARKEFLALIQSWHDQGRTIVMVSHAMEDLASLCSRIVVLSQGRVYKQGSPEEVFSSEEGMKAVGLGVPAAQHGALALREAGFPLTRTLYDVDSLAHDVAAFYEAVQVGGDNPSGGVSAQAACAKVNSTSGSVSAEAECAEAECAEAECAKAERAKGERAASDNTPGCSHE